MDASRIIKEVFIDPFYKKEAACIGVELEFPLLNLASGPVDVSMLHELLAHLLENGFRIGETDSYGRGVFLVNWDGDCLSFDNSYNNFEFAMEKDTDLCRIAHRFYALYDMVQKYLLPRNHSLTGMGSNPFQNRANSDPVAYPIYKTLRQFLSGFSGKNFHQYPDFPAWLSSVQTHLDLSPEILPKTLSLFSALDFVRGLLFANSLPLPTAKGFENTLCFRDHLWEKSGFGSIKNITGPVNGTFQSLDDIIALFLNKEIFLIKKGDEYEPISPISIQHWLNQRPDKTALDGYLSFRNIEITRRGTLEIRSDCAQPVGSAFAPPAFNLGLLVEWEKAEKRLSQFFETQLPESLATSPERNTLLRKVVIEGAPFSAEEKETKSLLNDLITLAESGLKKRGFGEETLIKPLYYRAENLVCPAKMTKLALKNNEPLKDIIAKYADPEYTV